MSLNLIHAEQCDAPERRTTRHLMSTSFAAAG
jgi:hypothetical protein